MRRLADIFNNKVMANNPSSLYGIENYCAQFTYHTTVAITWYIKINHGLTNQKYPIFLIYYDYYELFESFSLGLVIYR